MYTKHPSTDPYMGVPGFDGEYMKGFCCTYGLALVAVISTSQHLNGNSLVSRVQNGLNSFARALAPAPAFA